MMGPRLDYRSDIEGLRAIAILLVVAAHAKVPLLAGGFVGVDVFFVLSGYLITGLLVQEIRSTGRIGFAAFYARRFRRLLPALLSMLAGASALGWALLSPTDQPEQAMAAASASVWLSNFYFAFANFDYFSAGTEASLFLHTWSLGVEEQFYLVWPALLTLTLLATTSSPLDVRKLRVTMAVVFGASLLLCVAQTQSRPLFAFYLMPARAWQFALGALVFLGFPIPGEIDENPRSLRRACRHSLVRWSGHAGLVLIVGSSVLMNANTRYPGIAAILPSIGAAALLAAGTQSMEIGAGRLLSLQPLQAIGRVSYGWYLWHWPLLLLGATVLNMDNAWNRLGLVALSFVIASFSYRFFEKPIRKNRRLLRRPIAAVLSALALMIGAHLFAMHWHNSALVRTMQPDQARYQQVRAATLAFNRMGCDDWYRSADARICTFGQEDAEHTAVVMGDSVGLQWFPALTELFSKRGWRLLVLTKSACPMVDEPIFYARIGREYTECAEWREEGLRQVATLKPEIVIFGSAFNYELTQDAWTEGTSRVIQAVSSAAGQVYILRSTPVLPFDGPACLAPRSWLYALLSDGSRCSGPAHSARGDEVYRWLEVATGRFHNASLIDMTDAVCPDGLCRAEQHGIIVFRDTQHLNAAFTKTLAPTLADRMAAEKKNDSVRGTNR